VAEATKELLDAINAAVDTTDSSGTPATPEPPKTTETEPEEKDDDEAVSDDGGSGTDDDGAAAEGESGTPDGEGADGTDGAAKGVKGGEGDKGAEGGEKPKTDAEKAAEEAKAAAAKKPLDPVNDPIPAGVSERTRERITKLVDTVKSQAAEVQQLGQLFDDIQSTGMSPEELGSMLGYARARHHGTAEDKKTAYEFLKAELRALALELGQTDTVDFLADHEDLRAEVEENKISRERAQEIAIARAQRAHASEASTAAAAQTEQQRVYNAGRTALGNLGAALQKRDGAVYAAKKDIVVATLKPLLPTIHPSKWAQAFQQAYDNLKLPTPTPAPTPTPTPTPTPSPTPLRPGTPAGGKSRQPGSLRDAIDAAIDGSLE
jgi:hypothetical protein